MSKFNRFKRGVRHVSETLTRCTLMWALMSLLGLRTFCVSTFVSPPYLEQEMLPDEWSTMKTCMLFKKALHPCCEKYSASNSDTMY